MQVDFKCFNCNTLRSNVNQPKYKGRTPLDQLMEVTYLKHNTNNLDLEQRREDPNADFEIEDEDGDEKGFLGRAMRSTRKFKRSFRKSYGGKKVADISRSMTGGLSKMLGQGGGTDDE